MLRLIALFAGLAGPALSQTNLQEMRSSDIVAEIDYLSDLLPAPRRLNNTDRQAFEFFLASNSICNGLDYQKYAEFADDIASTFGGDVEMLLGQRSYSIRATEGCSIDLENKRIVESYLGAIETRLLVLESLRHRREEMLSRTLFAED